MRQAWDVISWPAERYISFAGSSPGFTLVLMGLCVFLAAWRATRRLFAKSAAVAEGLYLIWVAERVLVRDVPAAVALQVIQLVAGVVFWGLPLFVIAWLVSLAGGHQASAPPNPATKDQRPGWPAPLTCPPAQNEKRNPVSSRPRRWPRRLVISAVAGAALTVAGPVKYGTHPHAQHHLQVSPLVATAVVLSLIAFAVWPALAAAVPGRRT